MVYNSDVLRFMRLNAALGVIFDENEIKMR
jgi:hypothetical protein